MSSSDNQYQAHNIRAVFLICATFALLLLGLIKFGPQFAKKVPQPSNDNQQIMETPENTKSPTNEQSMIGKQALITKYENLTTITNEDLPTFKDIRDVFEYKDNLIIVGVDVIMEFDPVTNTILRINSDIFPNIFEALVLGDYLYVGVNADYSTNDKSSEIYGVNLLNGKVEWQLLGGKDIPSNFVNLDITSEGKWLWVTSGSDDLAVYRFSITDQSDYKRYSLKDLGYTEQPTCDNPLKFTKMNNKIEVVEFACKNFISTYDETTDTWDIKFETAIDPSIYINKDETDFDINVPDFYALIRFNEKTVVLSDDGLFEINEDTLPVKIAGFDIELFKHGYTQLFAFTELNKLVVVSTTYGPDTPYFGGNSNDLSEIIKFYSIDMTTFDVADLTSNISYEVSNEINLSASENISRMYDTKTIQEFNTLQFIEMPSQKPWLTINVDNNEVTILTQDQN